MDQISLRPSALAQILVEDQAAQSAAAARMKALSIIMDATPASSIGMAEAKNDDGNASALVSCMSCRLTQPVIGILAPFGTRLA
jgi:hypothetical protein